MDVCYISGAMPGPFTQLFVAFNLGIPVKFIVSPSFYRQGIEALLSNLSRFLLLIRDGAHIDHLTVVLWHTSDDMSHVVCISSFVVFQSSTCPASMLAQSSGADTVTHSSSQQIVSELNDF